MWFRRKRGLAPETRELVRFLRENGVVEYDSGGIRLSIAPSHLIHDTAPDSSERGEEEPTRGRLLDSAKMRRKLGLA